MAEAKAIAQGCYYVPDMAMPPNNEELIKELPRGQFYCNIGISYAQRHIKDFDPKQYVNEEVENILRLLPKGTSLISLRECGITELAVPYEAIFSHELLSGIKEVDIEYTYRFVEIDGKYKQVRLPVHIRYIPCNDETPAY